MKRFFSKMGMGHGSESHADANSKMQSRSLGSRSNSSGKQGPQSEMTPTLVLCAAQTLSNTVEEILSDTYSLTGENFSGFLRLLEVLNDRSVKIDPHSVTISKGKGCMQVLVDHLEYDRFTEVCNQVGLATALLHALRLIRMLEIKKYKMMSSQITEAYATFDASERVCTVLRHLLSDSKTIDLVRPSLVKLLTFPLGTLPAEGLHFQEHSASLVSTMCITGFNAQQLWFLHDAQAIAHMIKNLFDLSALSSSASSAGGVTTPGASTISTPIVTGSSSGKASPVPPDGSDALLRGLHAEAAGMWIEGFKCVVDVISCTISVSSVLMSDFENSGGPQLVIHMMKHTHGDRFMQLLNTVTRLFFDMHKGPDQAMPSISIGATLRDFLMLSLHLDKKITAQDSTETLIEAAEGILESAEGGLGGLQGKDHIVQSYAYALLTIYSNSSTNCVQLEDMYHFLPTLVLAIPALTQQDSVTAVLTTLNFLCLCVENTATLSLMALCATCAAIVPRALKGKTAGAAAGAKEQLLTLASDSTDSQPTTVGELSLSSVDKASSKGARKAPQASETGTGTKGLKLPPPEEPLLEECFIGHLDCIFAALDSIMRSNSRYAMMLLRAGLLQYVFCEPFEQLCTDISVGKTAQIDKSALRGFDRIVTLLLSLLDKTAHAADEIRKSGLPLLIRNLIISESISHDFVYILLRVPEALSRCDTSHLTEALDLIFTSMQTVHGNFGKQRRLADSLSKILVCGEDAAFLCYKMGGLDRTLEVLVSLHSAFVYVGPPPTSTSSSSSSSSPSSGSGVTAASQHRKVKIMKRRSSSPYADQAAIVQCLESVLRLLAIQFSLSAPHESEDDYPDRCRQFREVYKACALSLQKSNILRSEYASTGLQLVLSLISGFGEQKTIVNAGAVEILVQLLPEMHPDLADDAILRFIEYIEGNQLSKKKIMEAGIVGRIIEIYYPTFHDPEADFNRPIFQLLRTLLHNYLTIDAFLVLFRYLARPTLLCEADEYKLLEPWQCSSARQIKSIRQQQSGQAAPSESKVKWRAIEFLMELTQSSTDRVHCVPYVMLGLPIDPADVASASEAGAALGSVSNAVLAAVLSTKSTDSIKSNRSFSGSFSAGVGTGRASFHRDAKPAYLSTLFTESSKLFPLGTFSFTCWLKLNTPAAAAAAAAAAAGSSMAGRISRSSTVDAAAITGATLDACNPILLGVVPLMSLRPMGGDCFFEVFFDIDRQVVRVAGLTKSGSISTLSFKPAFPINAVDWTLFTLTYRKPKRFTIAAKATVAVYLNGISCSPLSCDSLSVDTPAPAVGVDLQVGRLNLVMLHFTSDISAEMGEQIKQRKAVDSWLLGPLRLYEEVLTLEQVVGVFIKGPKYVGTFCAEMPLSDHFLTLSCSMLYRCNAHQKPADGIFEMLGLKGLDVVVDPVADSAKFEYDAPAMPSAMVTFAASHVATAHAALDKKTKATKLRIPGKVLESATSGENGVPDGFVDLATQLLPDKSSLCNIADTESNLPFAGIENGHFISNSVSVADALSALGGPDLFMPLLQAASTADQICLVLRLLRFCVRQNAANLRYMQSSGYSIAAFILSQKPSDAITDQVVDALLDLALDRSSIDVKSSHESLLLVDSVAFNTLVLNHLVWNCSRFELTSNLVTCIKDLTVDERYSVLNCRRLSSLGVVRWLMMVCAISVRQLSTVLPATAAAAARSASSPAVDQSIIESGEVGSAGASSTQSRVRSNSSRCSNGDGAGGDSAADAAGTGASSGRRCVWEFGYPLAVEMAEYRDVADTFLHEATQAAQRIVNVDIRKLDLELITRMIMFTFLARNNVVPSTGAAAADGGRTSRRNTRSGSDLSAATEKDNSKSDSPERDEERTAKAGAAGVAAPDGIKSLSSSNMLNDPNSEYPFCDCADRRSDGIEGDGFIEHAKVFTPMSVFRIYLLRLVHSIYDAYVEELRRNAKRASVDATSRKTQLAQGEIDIFDHFRCACSPTWFVAVLEQTVDIATRTHVLRLMGLFLQKDAVFLREFCNADGFKILHMILTPEPQAIPVVLPLIAILFRVPMQVMMHPSQIKSVAKFCHVLELEECFGPDQTEPMVTELTIPLLSLLFDCMTYAFRAKDDATNLFGLMIDLLFGVFQKAMERMAPFKQLVQKKASIEVLSNAMLSFSNAYNDYGTHIFVDSPEAEADLMSTLQEDYIRLSGNLTADCTRELVAAMRHGNSFDIDFDDDDGDDESEREEGEASASSPDTPLERRKKWRHRHSRRGSDVRLIESADEIEARYELILPGKEGENMIDLIESSIEQAILDFANYHILSDYFISFPKGFLPAFEYGFQKRVMACFSAVVHRLLSDAALDSGALYMHISDCLLHVLPLVKASLLYDVVMMDILQLTLELMRKASASVGKYWTEQPMVLRELGSNARYVALACMNLFSTSSSSALSLSNAPVEVTRVMVFSLVREQLDLLFCPVLEDNSDTVAILSNSKYAMRASTAVDGGGGGGVVLDALGVSSSSSRRINISSVQYIKGDRHRSSVTFWLCLLSACYGLVLEDDAATRIEATRILGYLASKRGALMEQLLGNPPVPTSTPRTMWKSTATPSAAAAAAAAATEAVEEPEVPKAPQEVDIFKEGFCKLVPDSTGTYEIFRRGATDNNESEETRFADFSFWISDNSLKCDKLFNTIDNALQILQPGASEIDEIIRQVQHASVTSSGGVVASGGIVSSASDGNSSTAMAGSLQTTSSLAGAANSGGGGGGTIITASVGAVATGGSSRMRELGMPTAAVGVGAGASTGAGVGAAAGAVAAISAAVRGGMQKGRAEDIQKLGEQAAGMLQRWKSFGLIHLARGAHHWRMVWNTAQSGPIWGYMPLRNMQRQPQYEEFPPEGTWRFYGSVNETTDDTPGGGGFSSTTSVTRIKEGNINESFHKVWRLNFTEGPERIRKKLEQSYGFSLAAIQRSTSSAEEDKERRRGTTTATSSRTSGGTRALSGSSRSEALDVDTAAGMATADPQQIESNSLPPSSNSSPSRSESPASTITDSEPQKSSTTSSNGGDSRSHDLALSSTPVVLGPSSGRSLERNMEDFLLKVSKQGIIKRMESKGSTLFEKDEDNEDALEEELLGLGIETVGSLDERDGDDVTSYSAAVDTGTDTGTGTAEGEYLSADGAVGQSEDSADLESRLSRRSRLSFGSTTYASLAERVSVSGNSSARSGASGREYRSGGSSPKSGAKVGAVESAISVVAAAATAEAPVPETGDGGGERKGSLLVGFPKSNEAAAGHSSESRGSGLLVGFPKNDEATAAGSSSSSSEKISLMRSGSDIRNSSGVDISIGINVEGGSEPSPTAARVARRSSTTLTQIAEQEDDAALVGLMLDGSAAAVSFMDVLVDGATMMQSRKVHRSLTLVEIIKGLIGPAEWAHGYLYNVERYVLLQTGFFYDLFFNPSHLLQFSSYYAI